MGYEVETVKVLGAGVEEVLCVLQGGVGEGVFGYPEG